MWALCTLLQDIDRIFSNIIDIYEFSVTFLGLMEAAIEVADEGKQPAIGECFEEMAEVTLQFSIFLKESCPPVLFISCLPYLLLPIPSLPSCFPSCFPPPPTWWTLALCLLQNVTQCG